MSLISSTSISKNSRIIIILLGSSIDISLGSIIIKTENTSKSKIS